MGCGCDSPCKLQNASGSDTASASKSSGSQSSLLPPLCADGARSATVSASTDATHGWVDAGEEALERATVRAGSQEGQGGRASAGDAKGKRVSAGAYRGRGCAHTRARGGGRTLERDEQQAPHRCCYHGRGGEQQAGRHRLLQLRSRARCVPAFVAGLKHRPNHAHHGHQHALPAGHAPLQARQRRRAACVHVDVGDVVGVRQQLCGARRQGLGETRG